MSGPRLVPSNGNGPSSTDEAAEFLRVFEHSPTGAYRATPDGRVVLANATLAHMLGFRKAKELEAKELARFRLAPSIAWPIIRRRLEGEGQVRSLETIWTAKDGTTIITRENCWGIQDRDGRLAFIEGSVLDVTTRRAEEAGRVFNSVFEEVPVGFLQLDLMGQFIQTNWAFRQMVNYTQREIEKLTYSDLSGAEDRLADWQRLQQLLKDGKGSNRCEKRYRTRGGRTLWVQETASLFRDRHKNPRFVNLVVEDISDRKRYEAGLRHRTQELEAANRELESFAYTVSHDLRTPLRGIDGFSALLVQEHAADLPPQGRQLLARIRNATMRMSQLIEDLLNLSKVTRVEVKRQPVDLAVIASGVVKQLRVRDPRRRINVKIRAHLGAEGDPRLLEVVLRNLLDNAWKFTRKKSKPEISVGVQRIGEKRAFFVADNGAGFDMGLSEKLFQPFQRLHHADEFEGNGIGLATVQRIVHRHGGKVWLKSRPGRGTRVLFTL